MSFPHLGIALSGGGARGAAHIGVLQGLQKSKVKISVISGVSAGSVIGAMYAIDGDARWVEIQYRNVLNKYISSSKMMKYANVDLGSDSGISKIKHFLYQHFLQIIRLYRNSIISKDLLKKIISELLPVKTFEELKIPLKVCVTDLNSAKSIVYENGNLIEPLVKSCSIPGVIEPTIEGERVLVDGGILTPIPISVLKNECNFIIAVNIPQNKYSMLNTKSKMYDLKGRADLIISNRLKFIETKDADFVFNPDTMGTHWSNFQKFEDLVKSGKNEVKIKIEKLESAILLGKNNINKE